MKISLRQEERLLTLSVWDDGPGYPAWLVKEGPKPFGKAADTVHGKKAASADTVHFGMGLYSSRILCGKHGGALRLENGTKEEGGGARAIAVFACQRYS